MSVGEDNLLFIVGWFLGLDIVGIVIMEGIRLFNYLQYSFKGKHVVITGGSSGLGLELAKQIASEEANVTIIARRSDQLELARQEIVEYCEKKGLPSPSICAMQGDVCDQQNIQESIQKSIQVHGEVDVILCNAGTATTG